MSQKYYPKLTHVGLAKLTNAVLLNKQVSLTHMAVGDGSGSSINLDAKQLEHEVYRAQINEIRLDESSENTVLAVLVIPVQIGGFHITELGLFDSDGDLIAVGLFPATYKPALDEGTGREIRVQMKLQLQNPDAVTLSVDPSAVMATRSFVGAEIHRHEAEKHPVKWGEVIEKPNLFPPTAHDHNELYYTQAEVQALLVSKPMLPAGHIYGVPFPPNELPEHHYVANGEGLLKTSQAGKTLLSMSAAYKAAHRVTENATHVFLPNLFDENGDGYFSRFVNGVTRKVGSVQGDAAPNIVGSVQPNAIRTNSNSVSYSGALASTSMYKLDQYGGGHYSLNGGTLSIDASRSSPVYGRESAREIRPKNYGFTPAIYLPPMEA
ncbi:phage tail protein [Halodesulfovibrio sp.]|uniref:phage tail protein n=1 Tax=Halodesulfovibrio sp. TaxID=1912772 RepID=UPI0025C73CB1|nr:phage tail protein [Halodesulfovibrio sp.]